MYKCYTDSGYNNKSKSDGYFSFKIYEDDEQIDFIHDSLDNVITSNEAEYECLYRLLDYILNSGLESKSITIYMDSKLVVETVNQNWNLSKESLYPFYNKVIDLLEAIEEYTTVELIWNPREIMLKELGH